MATITRLKKYVERVRTEGKKVLTVNIIVAKSIK